MESRPQSEMVFDPTGSAFPFRRSDYRYLDDFPFGKASAEFESILGTATFDNATAAMSLRRAINETLESADWQVRTRGDGAWATVYVYTCERAVRARCVHVGTQSHEDAWKFKRDHRPLMREKLAEFEAAPECVPGIVNGASIAAVLRELVEARLAPFQFLVASGFRYLLVDLDDLRAIPADANRFPKPPTKSPDEGRVVPVDDRAMRDIVDGIALGANHYFQRSHYAGLRTLLDRRNIPYSIFIERADPDRPVGGEGGCTAQGEAALEKLRREGPDHVVLAASHEDGSRLEAHLDTPDPETARLHTLRAVLPGLEPTKLEPGGPPLTNVYIPDRVLVPPTDHTSED